MRHFLICFLGLAACAPRGGYVGGLPLLQHEDLGRVAVAGNSEVHIDAVESALIEAAGGKLTILARREQEHLAGEKSLSYSGDFSDDAVASMGKQLGAAFLFVGTGQTVELPKTRREPELQNCAAKFAPSSGDDDKELRLKRAQQKNCDEQNEETLRRADREFANRPAQKRYKLRLRVVDVTLGSVVANADFVGDEGEFGADCDFDCIKDKAARRAVRFLLTGSPAKKQQAASATAAAQPTAAQQ